MKINNKILSIPPYITTSWKNVVSLHVESRNSQPILIIGISNGSLIEVPNLDENIIKIIFKTYEKTIEDTPQEDVKKEYDEHGNLIYYDSSYSRTWKHHDFPEFEDWQPFEKMDSLC